MKWGMLGILALAIFVGAAAAGYWVAARRGRGRRPVGYVANTGYLRVLPAFERRVKLVRRAMTFLLIGATIMALATAALAAGPVKRVTKTPKTASRDIVLCLDVSGSMLSVDGNVLATFDQLVEAFNGERVALVIWNQVSRVVFPLTDDYDMVREQLTDAAEAIKTGIISKSADGYYITNRLADFLLGTTPIVDTKVSSLIGDGLANCTLSFDERTSERSRSIIIATDNEAEGKPIYTLAEAAKLAKSRNITVFGLYSPGQRRSQPQDEEEFRRTIMGIGGKFFRLNEPKAAEQIVKDIESQQRVVLNAKTTITESDRTEVYYPWVVLGILLLLGVAVGVRL